MVGKSQSRRRREARRRERLREKNAEASAALVAQTSRRLEDPEADEDLRGDHLHYLGRLKRLGDREQRLAYRLYYEHGRRRYIARSALGLKPWLVGSETDPVDLRSKTVAVALEPGRSPSRLVMDGRGKVKTLLAADMAVAVDRVVSFDEFERLSREFEAQQQKLQGARELVEDMDLARLCATIHAEGWTTPLEVLEPFLHLGPSTGQLLLHHYDRAGFRYGKIVVRAFLPGAKNDADLRRWWRASGALSAYLCLLADLGVEPDFLKIRSLLTVPDPLTAMVVGACVGLWRGANGEKLRAPELVFDSDLAPLCFQWAMIASFGVVRRRWLDQQDSDYVGLFVSDFVDNAYDASDKECRERERLGLPPSPVADFTRDLALLARGGRPRWGDDLVNDVRDLPPFLLRDLCSADGLYSVSPMRYLVQRLVSVGSSLTASLFSTRAELETWRERRGVLDEARTGTFRLPWVLYREPPTPRSSLPGRNDPCSCGSGKKYKRCCMEELEREKDE